MIFKIIFCTKAIGGGGFSLSFVSCENGCLGRLWIWNFLPYHQCKQCHFSCCFNCLDGIADHGLQGCAAASRNLNIFDEYSIIRADDRSRGHPSLWLLKPGCYVVQIECQGKLQGLLHSTTDIENSTPALLFQFIGIVSIFDIDKSFSYDINYTIPGHRIFYGELFRQSQPRTALYFSVSACFWVTESTKNNVILNLSSTFQTEFHEFCEKSDSCNVWSAKMAYELKERHFYNVWGLWI